MSAWNPSRASIRRTRARRSRRSLSVWRPHYPPGRRREESPGCRRTCGNNHAGQNLHNRIWGLLASTSLPQLLSPSEVEALVGELQRRQGKDGGWSLNGLGGWRWNRTAAPFQSPGQRDQELAAQVRWLCDRSDRLHAQASRCFGRARNNQERPAMAQSSPATHSHRRSGMARLARSLSQLRPRARRCQRRTLAAAVHVRRRHGICDAGIARDRLSAIASAPARWARASS